MNILFCSSNIVGAIKFRTLRWAEHVSRIEQRDIFKILTGKPTGKGPLGRSRRRWEEYIRMYLKEIGINTRIWLDLAQDMDY